MIDTDTAVQPTKTKVADVILTSSVYLATFLGTMGCKPFQVLKGPEKTQQGDKITKFVYDNNDGVAEDIYSTWGNPIDPNVPNSWSKLTKKEKLIVTNVVTAFCDNLRHFLNEVKNNKGVS